MKCRVCGSTLHATTTDLPFKVSDRTIVILKRLPVAQCDRCSEYLIADDVFVRVEELLVRGRTVIRGRRFLDQRLPEVPAAPGAAPRRGRRGDDCWKTSRRPVS